VGRRELIDDGQPQAGAAGFSAGHEWQEKPVPDRLGNPRPVVRNPKQDRIPPAPDGQIDTGRRRFGVMEGLGGVPDQVEQDAPDLALDTWLA